MRRILEILLIILSLQSFAIPAHPKVGQITQPDGTTLKGYLRGDEFHHWKEDENGYTIVKNNDHCWVYAKKNSKGELYPSEAVVGKIAPGNLGIKKSLSSDNALRRSRTRRASSRSLLKKRSTTVGTIGNLVILVDFPDLPHRGDSTVSAISKVFNQEGYNSGGAKGSVKDYFKEVSYGKLTVESTVVDWVTVSKSYKYYGENDENGEDSNPRTMVAEALALVEERGFDFSQVDNDNDGWIDGLTVIHAGFSEEYFGNSDDYIWSHQWQIPSPVIYDGVRIQRYHTEPEIMGDEFSPDTWVKTPIGVICHETTHFLGLPDLYDTDGSSAGVGAFCLMGGGSWNGNGQQPAHLSAWCKEKLAWVSPRIITENATYELPRVEDNQVIYKLLVQDDPDEYFLIENRQPVKFDTSLPGKAQGILIWHVDELQSNNRNENDYLVDLEQANDAQYLQFDRFYSGEDEDYFRSGNKTVFSTFSSPDNRPYFSKMHVPAVYGISDSKDLMSFSIRGDYQFSIEGRVSLNELSSTTYRSLLYSEVWDEYIDITSRSSWSTNSQSSSITQNGLFTAGNVFNDTDVDVTGTFFNSTSKSVKILDNDLNITTLEGMLGDSPQVQEEFYENVLAGLNGVSIDLLSNYQAEFKRNLVHILDNNKYYQSIVDEVNQGNNVIISKLEVGWNMISTPFENWSVDEISNSFIVKTLFSFDFDSLGYNEAGGRDDLSPGLGYWLKVEEWDMWNFPDGIYLMSGNFPKQSDGVISLGWNLIGPQVDELTLTGTMQGFSWNNELNGYDYLSSGTKLQLGKAYWIFREE